MCIPKDLHAIRNYVLDAQAPHDRPHWSAQFSMQETWQFRDKLPWWEPPARKAMHVGCPLI